MKTIYLKLIEKFFNGEMSPGEITVFEQDRKKNSGLDKAFLEYQQILEALKDRETLDLRQKLNDIRAEGNQPGDIISFLRGDNNWIWLAALLTVIIAMTLLIRYMVQDMPVNDAQILSEVIMPDSGASDKLSVELWKYSMRKHAMVLEVPTRNPTIFWRENIFFQWTVDSTYNLLLDVIDHEGNVVFVSQRPIQSPYVFKRRLKSDSYIFRFRDDKQTFGLVMIYTK